MAHDTLEDTLKYVEKTGHVNLDFVYLQLDNIKTLIGNDKLIEGFKDALTEIFDKNNNG